MGWASQGRLVLTSMAYVLMPYSKEQIIGITVGQREKYPT